MKGGYEVFHTKGREQPYTIVLNGMVIQFCFTITEVNEWLTRHGVSPNAASYREATSPA